jgi:AcrR family transcriptional regulator
MPHAVAMAVDARTQMIDAAERLAAEGGLGAMSLRAVQEAAGQRNKSAAQYHFGSRTGLIEAIVAVRMGPINERRIAMLRTLDESGQPDTLRGLAAALIEPMAEHTFGHPDSCWARFLVQGFSDPELNDVVRTSFDGRAYREVRARLYDAMTDLPEPIRLLRVDHAVALSVSALASAEASQADGQPRYVPPAVFVSNLLDTCTAVLEAPLSATTLAELDAGEARPA